MKEILIVGHGLAGAVLAHTLIGKNIDVLVLDKSLPHKASNVAGGIINPFIGPKLNIPEDFADCILHNQRFFREFSKLSGKNFLQQISMLRIFQSSEQKKLWISKSSSKRFSEYAKKILSRKQLDDAGIESTLGAGETHAHVVKVRKFLSYSESILRERDCWHEGLYKEEDWQMARAIVFCEGFRVTNNPWFQQLPFEPAKGEVLKIKSDCELYASNGTWHCPQPDHSALVGSTWMHNELLSGPTEGGRNEILSKLTFLKKIHNPPLEHKSGIRSGTRDRNPILGCHPDHDRLFIFNGFGSRGATTIPYYAQQMAKYIIDKNPLASSVSLDRFL